MTGAGTAGRLRVLVLEDERPARRYLVELLEATGQAEIAAAVGSLDEAVATLRAPGGAPVDVAFVDVHLAGEADERAGLHLVRELAASGRPPLFVLATAHDRHAIEAFDLGVVDYLLKPFSEERVAQALARVRDRLGARREPATPARPRIVARKRRSLVFLDVDEIWAFEAADRTTSVHTPHGVFDVELSLASVESTFGSSWARVHRNWLVNVAYIKALERDGAETRLFVGAGPSSDAAGLHVPVSRDRAHAVRDLLLAGAAGVRRG